MYSRSAMRHAKQYVCTRTHSALTHVYVCALLLKRHHIQKSVYTHVGDISALSCDRPRATDRMERDGESQTWSLVFRLRRSFFSIVRPLSLVSKIIFELRSRTDALQSPDAYRCMYGYECAVYHLSSISTKQFFGSFLPRLFFCLSLLTILYLSRLSEGFFCLCGICYAMRVCVCASVSSAVVCVGWGRCRRCAIMLVCYRFRMPLLRNENKCARYIFFFVLD